VKSENNAAKWFKKAAARGSEEAKEIITGRRCLTSRVRDRLDLD